MDNINENKKKYANIITDMKCSYYLASEKKYLERFLQYLFKNFKNCTIEFFVIDNDENLSSTIEKKFFYNSFNYNKISDKVGHDVTRYYVLYNESDIHIAYYNNFLYCSVKSNDNLLNYQLYNSEDIKKISLEPITFKNTLNFNKFNSYYCKFNKNN
ncbi:hypothetical protein LbFV_ORF30 [Leptopilina boulardi filamentous virus]|uniref:Uncharacterized protein n=1 Tax=Leptopilina boulardi filamentous virus TaxID=552509 RepID=A0A1S5YCZ5_9VIRU|nr:hypothetical protein LbFV_ORF30 [Leptopilina boulardi filamentous virus]AQQ79950.1 hypothetical protein LbFV_ORF30 [Leptopilina boulardi filamentous virus]